MDRCDKPRSDAPATAGMHASNPQCAVGSPRVPPPHNKRACDLPSYRDDKVSDEQREPIFFPAYVVNRLIGYP